MSPKSSRKYYKYIKKKKLWNEETLKLAVDEVQTSNRSIRSVAKEYHMSFFTLQTALKRASGTDTSVKTRQGRHNILSDEDEEAIADILISSARANFGFGLHDIPKLIKDYCDVHELGIWTGANQFPSLKYCLEFCRRHRITNKRPQRMSIGRISATSNPFVIYDFFDVLENEIAKLPDDETRPSRIINCDETNMHHDPAPRKVLGPVGEKFNDARITGGYANTTVLAACKADGTTLPPLVVFRGINLPPERTLEGCIRGMEMKVSKNGWMTAEIFAEWLNNLMMTEKLRPLLVIFDGAMQHLSVSVIERAMSENVILLKLPPNTTERLQPLDVGCFSSLKSHWNTYLQQEFRQTGRRTPLKKDEFCRFLSNVWFESLSPKNVKAGFSATGIFPTDRNAYPSKRFNPRLLETYQKWDAAGRPDMTDSEDQEIHLSHSLTPEAQLPQTSVSTPEAQLPQTPVSDDVVIPPKPVSHPVPTTQRPSSNHVAKWSLGWVPTWSLVPSASVSSNTAMNDTTGLSSNDRTARQFKLCELVLDRQLGSTSNTTTPKRKAEVLTKPNSLKRAMEREERTRKRKVAAAKNDKPKTSSKPPVNATDSNSDDEPAPLMQRVRLKEKAQMVRQTLESNSIGKFYAVFFDTKYYYGKVLNLIGPNGDDPDAVNVEMTFLHEQRVKAGVASQLYTWPSHPDVSIVSATSLFYGPIQETLKPAVLKSSTRGFDGKETFEFQEDDKVSAMYNQYKKNVHLLC